MDVFFVICIVERNHVSKFPCSRKFAFVRDRLINLHNACANWCTPSRLTPYFMTSNRDRHLHITNSGFKIINLVLCQHIIVVWRNCETIVQCGAFYEIITEYICFIMISAIIFILLAKAGIDVDWLFSSLLESGHHLRGSVASDWPISMAFNSLCFRFESLYFGTVVSSMAMRCFPSLSCVIIFSESMSTFFMSSQSPYIRKPL